MSGRGGRLRAPSCPSLTSQVPSFLSDNSNHGSPISNSLFIAGGQHPASRHLYTDGHDSLIFVRDPPRERLPAFCSLRESEDLPLLDRVAGRSESGPFPSRSKSTTTTRDSSTDFYADIYHYYHDRQHTAKTPLNVFPISLHGIQSTTNDDMVKKRNSIQAILVPSFLQGPLSPDSSPPSPATLASRIRALSGSTPSSPFASTSAITLNPLLPNDKHTRQRSMTFSSPRSSPPPAFLLDDDPFADLTSAPSESLKGCMTAQIPNDASLPPLPPIVPRSPLHSSPSNTLITTPSSPNASSNNPTLTVPPQSPLPRTVSGGRVQVRPAYQRPAFKSRPSLPSLHTLARMNIVLTKKVRKGRPGAGLPFEPWDLPSDDESTPPASASPRREAHCITPTSVVPTSSHIDLNTASDSAAINDMSTSRTFANPQPLLPSQIMSLGSIAADVEMVIPVPRTHHVASSLSPRQSELYQMATTLPDTSLKALIHAENLSLGESESPIYPMVSYAEPPSPTDGDGYVADFLERYHQSSRNGSEDGHDLPSERSSTAVTSNATPLAQVPEGPDTHEYLPYIGTGHQKVIDNEENSGDLEEIVFSDNSYLPPDHSSEHDALYFTNSDSMLFSSPPSSFTLSRSLSSASHSSYASASSGFDVTDDEDADLADFSSDLPRTDHAYRHFMDPSLSSLELDMDADESPDVGNVMRTGTSTSSSSSRPSLSLTRSSSNCSSDVIYSPTLDDYAMFPLNSEHHLQFQLPATPAPPELASAADVLLVSATELSRVVHDGSLPSAGWVNTFGESGVIGEDFSFGFDKLTLTGEENDEGVESGSLEAGMRVNLDRLARSGDTVTNSIETAVEPVHSSSFPNGTRDLAQTSPTELVTTPPSPSAVNRPQSQILQEEMPGQLSTAPRPVSAIKTVSLEPVDGSHSQTEGYRRAHVPASSPRQGNETTGRTSSSVYRTGYSSRSRGYDGHGREDSEDEDERRRRRRALERTHVVETVAKATLSKGESSEDDTDPYASASPVPTTSRDDHLTRPRLGRSPSRSPVTHHSPLLAGTSMRPSTNFPLSSSSSRYVSEEEDVGDSEDDDVPLAKAIPGALSAQKTIRRQVREEREQKKRERALRNEAEARRERQTTIRPTGAGTVGGNAEYGVSSSRDAAAMAVAAVASSSIQGRQRTLTLPGKPSGQPVFNPQDLARKLQSVQLADHPQMPYGTYQPQSTTQTLARQPSHAVHSSPHQQANFLSRAKSFSRPSGESQYSTERPHQAPSPMPSAGTSPALLSRSIREPHIQRHSPSTSPIGEAQPPLPNLRHMRSFHRSSERSPQDSPRSLVSPEEDRRANYQGSPSFSNPVNHKRSMSLSRRDVGERAFPTEPVPPLPSNLKTSHDEHRRLMKSNPTSTRTSAEGERPPRMSEPPPLPAAASRNVAVTQQRVFVGNLQQFHMVEIGPATTAGDVVSLMENQGALKGWAGMGGWMVFEMAQDFGMERPVRSYELLAGVQSSWLKDKTVNYFMLKLTPLAVPLSRSAIPSSSPTHSGYIEYEVKRGKWSKRWVQLKEHSLWISKRDNGKDESLICSLSNFDAYLSTRLHRAPKPFTFTIKSTDKMSLFENTDDYMHSFSCSEKDGNAWMEKILVARSYVLHQERHILFGASTSPSSGPVILGAPLARAATRKTSAAHRPVQPLINMQPFQMSAVQNTPHADVFEPGSLLYPTKQA